MHASLLLAGLCAAATVEIDWAKCCDCEAGYTKTPGQPCTATVKKGDSLNLKYAESQWMHNLYQVADQAALDSCTLSGSADHALVAGTGGNSMDHTIAFNDLGTFYYACTVMCTDETALGGTAAAEYCHCSAYAHKLVVTVTDDGPTALTSTAPDLVAMAQSSPDHSTLVTALTTASLVATLQGAGPFTVFAPTNDAFAALATELGTDAAGILARDDLAAILTYHVLPAKVMAGDLSGEQAPETVNGATVKVTKSASGVMVNDAAKVTTSDIAASNGVIHVIDKVLLPPSTPAPTPEAPVDSGAAVAAAAAALLAAEL